MLIMEKATSGRPRPAELSVTSWYLNVFFLGHLVLKNLMKQRSWRLGSIKNVQGIFPTEASYHRRLFGATTVVWRCLHLLKKVRSLSDTPMISLSHVRRKANSVADMQIYLPNMGQTQVKCSKDDHYIEKESATSLTLVITLLWDDCTV